MTTTSEADRRGPLRRSQATPVLGEGQSRKARHRGRIQRPTTDRNRLDQRLARRRRLVPKLSPGGRPEVSTDFVGFEMAFLGRHAAFWTRAEPERKVNDPLYMFLYMFGFIKLVKSSDDLPQIDELFPRSSPNQ